MQEQHYVMLGGALGLVAVAVGTVLLMASEGVDGVPSAASSRAMETARGVTAVLTDAHVLVHEPPDSPQDLDDLLGDIDRLDASDGGRAAVKAEIALLITSAASAVDNGLTVDRVRVEREGRPEIARNDDESLSVTVDLRIERHIADDDVDWIEIIPHVLQFDPDGLLTGLTAQDLKHEVVGSDSA